MAKREGEHIIRQMRQQWINYQLLADVLMAIAISLLAIVVISCFVFNISWICVLIFGLVLLAIGAFNRPWQVTLKSICSFLNTAYPQLEESSQLAIKPADELNILEQLQLAKVEHALTGLTGTPKQFTKRLKLGAILVAIAAVVSFGAAKTNYHWQSGGFSPDITGKSTTSAPTEKVLLQIESVTIKITPPAYTGKALREQDKFTIDVEEGATVSWVITTNFPVKTAWLLFNEKEKVPLIVGNTDKTKWKAAKTIIQPGFYQVAIDGKLSDLYQVQVIKDGAPIIRIKTPKQYTHIDAGEKPQVNLTANIQDDYGIADALIFATVAKGSGEGVKFKEYKLNFNALFGAHNRSYDVQKLIDLPALNMEPGDELYFYIQAQDNHQQKSRTDVYIVSIQDTAQLLSMDGLVTGTNLKPEFFRSERQIIIDTQQLLKEKDSLSTDVFDKRCNDLGIDQKLLRLRYGKFLGEEDESGKEGNDELAKVENFSNAQMFMDAYTDKHDNAEDASFLEPEVKAQLKATLTEMWKAELQLRLFKPADALPFEYKALRLLKDLQQKSRAYVAKTSYNPPPLKLEKRLSGDLTKIGQPIKKQEIKSVEDRYAALKKTVTILEQLKYGHAINSADRTMLQLAGQLLSDHAAAEPSIYLPAIAAIHRLLVLEKEAKLTDIALVEKAIQKTLPPATILPTQQQAPADMGLAQGYYKNLNHLNR